MEDVRIIHDQSVRKVK